MKLLCFGDSNTYGYDPRAYFGSRYPAQHRWTDLLGKQLGCEIINEGENGREIPHCTRDFLMFDRMLASQGPVDLLILLLGTNDLLQGNSVQTVAQRMASFLERVLPGTPGILLIGPPILQRGEWVPTQALIDASAALNREYSILSRRLGVGFADAGGWNIPLAFDGVHFTQEGHNAFAERLADYLKN